MNHIEVLPEKELTLKELKFLKSELKNYEIIIHAPFRDLNLVSFHSEIQKATNELYLRTIKYAKILGTKLITIHGGKRSKFIAKKDTIKMAVQNLKKIKSKLPGKVALAIENPPPINNLEYHFPNLFEDWPCLKNSLPWLGLTFDVGHAIQTVEKQDRMAKILKENKNSIFNIHLHDATLEKDHLVLGKGNLDLPKFLKILNKIHYKNYLSLETIPFEDTKSSWKKLFLVKRKYRI